MRATRVAEDTIQDLLAERYMRISEAAKFLALSRAKVYALMDAKELSYIKFGIGGHPRHRRYRRH